MIKVRECVHRFLAGFLSKFIGPVSMFFSYNFATYFYKLMIEVKSSIGIFP